MERIVLCYPATSEHLRRIREAAPQHEVVDAGQQRIADEILRADIYCGHAKVPVDWDRVVGQVRLRWIQSSAAGLDHCLVPSVVASSIPVTSASGLFAPQVAEHTLALLLGILRSLPAFVAAQQDRRFERLPTRDLRGAVLGIAGFGGNGRRIAELAQAFGATILATDMFPEQKPAYVQHLWHGSQWERMLPLVDILILCVPLTRQTTGMLNARTLALLPPGAILINVARGPVVVEADLVEALRTGHLSAAGLDVTEVEPLPRGSPLWSLPNVWITPHVGAQSADRLDRTTDFFCENLRRFLRGLPLLNLVDKQTGYPRPNLVLAGTGTPLQVP